MLYAPVPRVGEPLGIRDPGGEGGIRTHGTVTRTLDFESSPFDHSGTSPRQTLRAPPPASCRSRGELLQRLTGSLSQSGGSNPRSGPRVYRLTSVPSMPRRTPARPCCHPGEMPGSGSISCWPLPMTCRRSRSSIACFSYCFPCVGADRAAFLWQQFRDGIAFWPGPVMGELEVNAGHKIA